MKNTSLFLSVISYATGCIFILLSIWTGLSINKYHSPLEFYNNETIEHGSQITEKVVFVIVDGLRYDTSCKLNFLNSLREHGGDFISWTEIPSLSYPGWSALLSGAKPEISGKLLNWDETALRAENLFSITKEMNLENAVVGCPEWWILLGDNITGGKKIEGSGDFIDADAEVKNEALRVLRNPPVLTLIHFLSVDTAGHLYGGTSEEYLARAIEIDAYIKEICSVLDWNSTTLIVTSDHGHIDRGGHGGDEPLARKAFIVFYGKGIKKAKGEISQIDICPTISNLLGIKIPSLTQGRILFEVLDQRQENRVMYTYLLAKQRFFFAKTYLEVLGTQKSVNSSYIERAYEEILSGNFSKAEKLSYEGLEEYNLEIEKARDLRIFKHRMEVGVFSFLGLLLASWLTGMIILREKTKFRDIVTSLFLACFVLIIYFSIFFLIGMDFSFSVFNETNDVLRAILISFFVPGSLLFLTVTLYGYIGMKRQHHTDSKITTVGLGLYGTTLIFFSMLTTVNGIMYGYLFTDFVTHINEFMRVFLGCFICAGLLMYLGASLQAIEWMKTRRIREL